MSIVEVAGAAIVRPGDVLIVAVPWQLTQQQVHRLRADFHEQLPELLQVLVVEAAQLLVFRSDEVAGAGAGG